MAVGSCRHPFTFKGSGSSSCVKGCSNTTAASTFCEWGSVCTNLSNCSSVSKPFTGKRKHTQRKWWVGMRLSAHGFCLPASPAAWPLRPIALTDKQVLAYWVSRLMSPLRPWRNSTCCHHKAPWQQGERRSKPNGRKLTRREKIMVAVSPTR